LPSPVAAPVTTAMRRSSLPINPSPPIASKNHNRVNHQPRLSWAIDEAQATFDEAGRVQLIVDASIHATGTQSTAQVGRLYFHATTLARV
jgi:hypothetical protein